MFNLQVIWVIGISMIVLSGLIYLDRYLILLIAIVLIAGHNLLDNIHVPGTGGASLLWSILHEEGDFVYGNVNVLVHFPLLPWIGIIALGYYFGSLYDPYYDAQQRKLILFFNGIVAITLFFVLRSFNIYGDPAQWSMQKNIFFSVLSMLNVTKYPPSLLYTLITLGPAMLFLSLAEKPLNAFTKKVAVFGRVPFFYYILHLFVIHLLAVMGALFLGYNWSDMILTTRVNRVPGLKGYGFNLATVYVVWVSLILLLYPCCKWFDRYKRSWQSEKHWLTYI